VQRVVPAPHVISCLADRRACDAQQPRLRQAAAGPGANPVKSVSRGFNLADCGGQRLPQCFFQVVLGHGHRITSLPAES
jgi:hypothetical protein